MKRPVEKNVLEWTVFAVGLILVLATVGYLVREAISGASSAPQVVVHLGSPEQVTEGFQVPVTVVNQGDQSLEGVSVKVIRVAGTEREEGVLNIAFLPRDSRHEAWITFRGKPGDGQVQVGPVTYASP